MRVMDRRHEFRQVRWGVDRLPAHLVLPRHRHDGGYANVVLAGSFIEASFVGRFRVHPGDVLLHAGFDCHSNCDTGPRGPTILRLPWKRDAVEGRWRVCDPDLLARAAERDPLEASVLLEQSLEPGLPGQDDWPALLAGDLAADPSLRLGAWAAARGLAMETVSRGFARTFGVSPGRFRLEVRTRRAWRSIIASARSLTEIAHEHGFADLAHMTRSVRALTGRPPSRWRAA
jgi:AraC-like DNA-binding protein